jgi:flagellar protein FlgJ
VTVSVPSISDFAPLNLDLINTRVQENPVRKMGEFQSILEGEMKRVDPQQEPPGRQKTAITDKKLLEVCYEMESIFIGQMLKTMRKTIMETDFFGKSMMKDVFNDMLYEEYARNMARTDQFGLARQIYSQVRD